MKTYTIWECLCRYVVVPSDTEDSATYCTDCNITYINSTNTYRCKHCALTYREHAYGACLFSPTRFYPWTIEPRVAKAWEKATGEKP